jgi:acetylcholinesterase
MQNNYPHLTIAETDEINEQYPLMPPLPKHAAYFPSASAAYGEATFTCPGNFIALTFAKTLSPYKVWNYRYNVLQANNVASGLGVPHTFESPAIFGLGNANDNILSSYATYNAEIIPVMMDYWISFVRELTPNRYKYSGAPHWESFGDGKDGGRRIVLQTNETAMEKIPADQLERCEFWRGLAITMEQ